MPKSADGFSTHLNQHHNMHVHPTSRSVFTSVSVGVQVSKKNIGSGAGAAPPSGKDSVMDVVVMENVLYAANTSRIYDLKGSERSRWSQEDPSQAGAVLMDDNLRENNLTQPILVSCAVTMRLLSC